MDMTNIVGERRQAVDVNPYVCIQDFHGDQEFVVQAERESLRQYFRQFLVLAKPTLFAFSE